MKKWTIIIALYFTVPVSIFAFSITSAHYSTCENYARIPAYVISQHKVYITSKLIGYIKDLKVDIGSRVKKGEILLKIDPVQTYQIIKQAKANLNQAQFIFKRTKALYEKHVVSKNKFIETKSMFLQAKAQYEKSLNLLKYTLIKSPFDGIVIKKFFSNGALAVISQPILELIQTNNYLVRASIPDSIFSTIKPNQVVRIIMDNKFLKGKIEFIDPSENPITHSHIIKIKPLTTKSLYPGKFCLVNINIGKRKCLLIPLTAKTQRGSINGVFVVKHGKAYFRMVNFGKRIGKMIEVLSGLNKGERIITNPPYYLTNNTPINSQ